MDQKRANRAEGHAAAQRSQLMEKVGNVEKHHQTFMFISPRHSCEVPNPPNQSISGVGNPITQNHTGVHGFRGKHGQIYPWDDSHPTSLRFLFNKKCPDNFALLNSLTYSKIDFHPSSPLKKPSGLFLQNRLYTAGDAVATQPEFNEIVQQFWARFPW